MVEFVDPDLHLLPILAEKLSPGDWEAIRAAKASLDLPFLVKPVPAVHGSPGRVLAIGKKPDWLCDGAYISSTASKGLAAAIEYVLTDKNDARGFSVLSMLQDILGPDVREITDADIRSTDNGRDERVDDARGGPKPVDTGRGADRRGRDNLRPADSDSSSGGRADIVELDAGEAERVDVEPIGYGPRGQYDPNTTWRPREEQWLSGGR
jgi:hypothetical protein